ncbi:hypothetical protein [Rhodococcus sp. NPDC047139]|uniref:hypothetical protein n=1 Tax=Rhodococcus sp. NPDC047139 TaxID=3155141 RepID=UPI0033E5C47F
MTSRIASTTDARQRAPAGLGEIKPDHVLGRREGLTQLRYRLCVYDKYHPGAIQDLWLIAYSIPKGSGARPVYLDVRAFRFDPRTLRKLQPNERAEFDKLYAKRVEDRIPLTSPTKSRTNRSGFGISVEKTIRDWFVKTQLGNRPVEPGTGSNRPGADIIWYELAALYGELAAELSDPHFGELARQLYPPTGRDPRYVVP